jgi:hypothetical protein
MCVSEISAQLGLVAAVQMPHSNNQHPGRLDTCAPQALLPWSTMVLWEIITSMPASILENRKQQPVRIENWLALRNPIRSQVLASHFLNGLEVIIPLATK